MSALTAAGSTRAWRALRPLVFDTYGDECLMTRDGRPCGRPATTVDHVTPRARGGTDALENLRPACADCNTRAGGLLVAAPAAVPDLTPALGRLVARLDDAGVPNEAGRRTALRLLGRPAPSADQLDAACRIRRARSAGTPPPSRPW